MRPSLMPCFIYHTGPLDFNSGDQSGHSSALCDGTLLLQVRSEDQQPQPPLGAWWSFRILHCTQPPESESVFYWALQVIRMNLKIWEVLLLEHWGGSGHPTFGKPIDIIGLFSRRHNAAWLLAELAPSSLSLAFSPEGIGKFIHHQKTHPLLLMNSALGKE